MSWQKFEQKTRDLASLRFGRVAEKDRINGVNLDCVLKLTSDQWVIVEATIEKDVTKIRTDIAKIELVRRSLYDKKNIMSQCFVVCRDEPTQGMKDAAKDYNISVVSLSTFERQFLNIDSYYHLRSKQQFGSAVHPLTGEPDTSDYVPVAYRFEKNGVGDNLERICQIAVKNRDVIILGEYGSGKSRCIRELFFFLTEKYKGLYYYFV